jgi:hypothetical protein
VEKNDQSVFVCICMKCFDLALSEAWPIKSNSNYEAGVLLSLFTMFVWKVDCTHKRLEMRARGVCGYRGDYD